MHRSYQSKGLVISCGGHRKRRKALFLCLLAPYWAQGALGKGLAPTVLSPYCLHLCVAPIVSGLSQSLLTHLPASAFSVPIQQPKWSCHHMRQIMLFSVQTPQRLPVSLRVKAKVLTTTYIRPSMTWIPHLQALSPLLSSAPPLPWPPTPTPILHSLPAELQTCQVGSCLRAFALAADALECFPPGHPHGSLKSFRAFLQVGRPILTTLFQINSPTPPYSYSLLHAPFFPTPLSPLKYQIFHSYIWLFHLPPTTTM